MYTILKRGDCVKCRLLCILFLCLFISSCNINTDSVTKFNKLSSEQTQSQLAGNNLRIINSNTYIKHGDFGFITIEGLPKTKYKITTSFKKDQKVISVTQWRVTDVNGNATFNWIVDSETIPGTYPAVITGGGKKLDTYHTVLP